jgi:hypothetical protein
MNLPKIDPSLMYIVLEGYVGSDGIVYRTGDRVRGSHEEVRKHPEFYVIDGLSTDEIHTLHQQRFANLAS